MASFERKILRIQSDWDSEAWKTKAEKGRLSRNRLRDYKRENLENKGKQEVIIEESSKEGTGLRGAVLPDMMVMRKCILYEIKFPKSIGPSLRYQQQHGLPKLEINVSDFKSGTLDRDFIICQVIYSQFGLAIHQNDHQARGRFVEWAQNEIAVVPDFYKRILFSDEAHFWLKGYVNKQNCRIWSEDNPQVYVETPLHPEKLTVWCALWAGGIIGPYFFKNDEGHNVTVNGDRYRAMITNFFIPELNDHDVQELWFQQDGATCHTARATIDLLKDTFGDRLISRFGPLN
ncbi:putative DD41D transposase [Trichonephila clavipes]|uniref:Putative DD41D transposase n=1 Tax=Trichonephila clavipes TaxID=2585209 RepID=A0A8X6V2N8_TRICX|nr:putative DD41D transposase [Trichonephila clavipes]